MAEVELITPTTPGWAEQLRLLLNGQARFQNVARTHSHAIRAVDLPEHGTSVHTNRTRLIALNPRYDARTGIAVVMADNTHGSLGGYHIDQGNADANFKQIRYDTIPVPADYVSGGSVVIIWSRSVGTGNTVFDVYCGDFADGSTANTDFSTAGNVVATPAADTLEFTTIALTNTPLTAGRAIQIRIDPNTNSASDSATGLVSIWGAYFSYTADM